MALIFLRTKKEEKGNNVHYFRRIRCTATPIDEAQAKIIATNFLGQHHSVVKIDATLGGGERRKQWKLAVHTTQKTIEVLLDAEDGKILGYSPKQ